MYWMWSKQCERLYSKLNSSKIYWQNRPDKVGLLDLPPDLYSSSFLSSVLLRPDTSAPSTKLLFFSLLSEQLGCVLLSPIDPYCVFPSVFNHILPPSSCTIVWSSPFHPSFPPFFLLHQSFSGHHVNPPSAFQFYSPSDFSSYRNHFPCFFLDVPKLDFNFSSFIISPPFYLLFAYFSLSNPSSRPAFRPSAKTCTLFMAFLYFSCFLSFLPSSLVP